jgi:NAD(P)-dependent dehydrogenase (short-subunit alcohol dehydrogenase family)
MKKPSFSLDGQVALITGASLGIGLAIAKAFCGAGAKITISSRKQENLERALGEIKAECSISDDDVLIVPAHSGKPDHIENLVKKVLEKFGKIDILVNNAATNPIVSPLHEFPLEAWNKVMEVNLTGCFITSKLVIKSMLERKIEGSIINIATVAGFRAAPILGAYGVSKAGVISLTRTMAYELAPFGIRVNAIAPGLVKTKFSEYLWKGYEKGEYPIQRIPIGRLGHPNDIVGAALYLASDASSFVTGSVLVVDGGSSI